MPVTPDGGLSSARRVAEVIGVMAASRPLGVFLDIDGTISRIAPTPADAVVSDRARKALLHLAKQVERLTFISGRSPADAAAMVAVSGDNIAYVGNHGLSLLIGDDDLTPDEALPYVERVQEVVRDIRGLHSTSGVLFEERGPLLTIHYRLAEDQEAARESILAALKRSEAAGGMELSEGRKIVELRPPLDINKGDALERLCRQWDLASILMIGDDITDISAFDALRRLRDYDNLATLSVAVASAEADPAVAAAADHTVDGVAAVEALLEQLTAIEIGRLAC
jgi:trehalose 6-phosphate phosphatase